MLLTSLGFVGLLALSIVTKKGLPTAASALLVAPWAMVVVFGWNLSYQHYKALSSVAPLLPVGIACLGHAARLATSATWVAYGAAITRFTLGAALGLTLISTLNLTFRAGGGLGLTAREGGEGDGAEAELAGGFEKIPPGDLLELFESRIHSPSILPEAGIFKAC